MIEPARIVARGKLKIAVKAVKSNIHTWNEQHQLGLTNLREKANAATWHLTKGVVAVRKRKDNVNEIMSLVEHRQSNYQ